MAAATLTREDLFPNGTTVSAYPAANWLPDQDKAGAPLGAATASTTAAAGVQAFTGLSAKTDYYAVAQVSGVYRYVRFTTPAARDWDSIAGVERSVNSIGQTTRRDGRHDALTAVASGTLIVARLRNKIPKGVAIGKARGYLSGTAVTTPTAQWMLLLDAARKVLAISTDRTTSAWGGDTSKLFTFPTPYVSTDDDFIPYVGLVVVCATPGTLQGATHRFATLGGGNDADSVAGTAVALAGLANTGLTGPADLAVGATAAALTNSGGIPHFEVFEA